MVQGKQITRFMVKHGTCKLCDRSASFGYKKDNIRSFCALHKESDMVNLTKRICMFCAKTASFGYPDGPSALLCSEHKESGMVHTSYRKNKRITLPLEI